MPGAVKTSHRRVAVQRHPEACADDDRRHLVGDKPQAKKDRYRKTEKKLTVICNTVTRKSGRGEEKRLVCQGMDAI